MYYTQAIATTRVGVVKTLIDSSVSNGRLEILAGSTVLASFQITKGAMTYQASVLSGPQHHFFYSTYSTSTATCSNTGVVTKARVVDGDGNVVIDNISVDRNVEGSNTSYDGRGVNAYYAPFTGIYLNRLSFTSGDLVSLDGTRFLGDGAKFWLGSI